MHAGPPRPILRVWRPLVATDLLYRALAFAVLTPLVGLLLRVLIRSSGRSALADADIALFFFTTRRGVLALILVSALFLAITALQQASLMTVALGALRGVRLRVRDAFAASAARAFAVVRATIQLVLRLLGIAAPFVAALGLVYWGLLTGHDINYYLAEHPPRFWVALGLGGAIVLGLAVVLLWKMLDWLLVLPLVVFENVLPIFAFAESARRMKDPARRRWVAVRLVGWALLALALPPAISYCARAVGRAVAPAFSGSIVALVAFSGVLVLSLAFCLLAAAVLVSVLFAAILSRAYAADGAPAARLPEAFHGELLVEGHRWRVSWKALASALVGVVLLATAGAWFVLRTAWSERPLTIFAHRGAAAHAPENTLAAFRLAGEQGTDYVELDVQESLDGVVVIAHDKDLMKVGGSPLLIWETNAAQLREVDVGSRFDPRFASERVATLADALEACKGVSRVNIELKDYGHGQRLEELVVEAVEAAGMQDQIVTMSLSRERVAGMKRLRPDWPAGLLVAQAVGVSDLSDVKADFFAVNKSMATRRFLRRARRAGKPVYVWTVNDRPSMVRLIGLGVDGLITDDPAIAREVVSRYERMSQAERLFLFVMTQLHATLPPQRADGELRY